MQSAWPIHGAIRLVSVWLIVGVHGWSADFIVSPGGSIQAAVNAALANSDASDTIAVLPAVFDEAVTIDYGSSNQQSLLIGRADNFRPIITDGVTITDARLVTLYGFEVRSAQGDGEAAIRISDTVGAAILDCVVPDGDDGGVDALDTFEVIVDGCRMNGQQKHGNDSNGFGVRIIGRSCHRITDSKFLDNEFRGVWVEADRVEIRKTKVTKTGNGNEHVGVYLDGRLNLLKDCTVSNNDGGGLIAIGTFDIRGNKINENGGIGLRLGMDTGTQFFGGVVRQNTIDDNGSFGISVRSGQDGAEIAKNVIDGNRNAGIELQGDGHLVDDNTISGTQAGSESGFGVLIDAASDDNCVRGNTFNDNDSSAVRVNGDFNYVLLNVAKDGDSFITAGGTTGNEGRANKTSGQNDFP